MILHHRYRSLHREEITLIGEFENFHSLKFLAVICIH